MAAKNAGSVLCWSRTGKLVNGGDGIVSLQRQFKEPGVFTVQFSLYQIDPLNPFIFDTPNFTEAIIEWQVAGNTISRTVSVANGTSISGVGEGVRVVAYDASPGENGFTYGVAITVSRGLRPVSGSPPVYRAMDAMASLNAGASDSFDIPNGIGANAVQVYISNTTGVIIADQGPIVTQRCPTTVLAQYDPRWGGMVPLIPGANQIAITNNTLAAFNYFILFGVDG